MQGSHYLEDAISQFRKLKALAEKALAQVSDEQFFATLDTESNSLALIVKHMAGNLRSRWMGYHVGEMVLLAKHYAGPSWQTLSIPCGR